MEHSRAGHKSSPARRVRNLLRWNARVAAKLPTVATRLQNAISATCDFVKSRGPLDHILVALEAFVTRGCGPIARAVLAEDGIVDKSRRRDRFPLPRILGTDPVIAGLHHLLLLANLCVASLNSYHSCGRFVSFACQKAARPSSAQRAVHQHVVARCEWLAKRLNSFEADATRPHEFLQHFEASSSQGHVPLTAAHVDVADQAATCDVMNLVSAPLRARLENFANVFPSHSIGVNEIRMSHSSMDEYANLIMRKFHVGQLVCFRSPRGVASIFTVSKPNGRLRAVWNGSEISEACEKPPPPRRLGNPAAFVDIVLPAGSAWNLSKRDGAAFFDCLAAPDDALPWFCSPPLRASILAAVLGMSLAQLADHCVDDVTRDLTGDDMLFPSSRSWPMGYSWSSAVAQDTTLGMLREAGVPETHILCDTMPPPADCSEVCVAQTDDAIFMHTDASVGCDRLRAYDAAMARNGVDVNLDKNVTLAPHLKGLGCSLTSSPPRVDADAAKLYLLLGAVFQLAIERVASPAAVNSILGLAQWFALLSRPHFGVFNHIYAFVRRTPDHVKTVVPRKIIDELMLFCLLSPLLTADITRPWLPFVVATDAAPDFGFGLSVGYLGCDIAGQIGRLAERRGEYVRLSDENVAEFPVKQRLGTPHSFGIGPSHFRDVLSLKAKRREHSGLMELKGILLAIKWVCRTVSHFHGRLTMLIDAKAALACVAKGRTGAPAWRPTLSAINAYLLACDLLLRPVYITSEQNPADPPSRGRRKRVICRGTSRPPRYSKFEKRLHKFIVSRERAYEKLNASGMLGHISFGSSSS